MIHHLVLLKFKPGIDPKQIDELTTELEDLPNQIIEIHLYEFGPDLRHAKRSYDFGVSALFGLLLAVAGSVSVLALFSVEI